MTKLRGTEISLLFHASIWEKYHSPYIFRRTDMDENYHRHFSNFFSQRSEKTIFRKRKILKLEKLNIESKGYDTFEKQRVSYFVMRKCLKCTDLGVVVIGSAGVDGAGGCGGC